MPNAGESRPSADMSAQQGRGEYASSAPPGQAVGYNLASKVELIREMLGLERGMDMVATLQEAQQTVGCRAEGSLNDQADALLFELVPAY